jgi:hypothetical protein
MSTTAEIRQCLTSLQVDEKLIEHFIELLTIVRAKALNGQRTSVSRLQDLLVEAVSIDPRSCDAYGALNDALEVQICKTKASLKKFM